MEDLVRLVMHNAKLPEDAARRAVDTVIAFLRQRLPGTVEAHIDLLLGGDQVMKRYETRVRYPFPSRRKRA